MLYLLQREVRGRHQGLGEEAGCCKGEAGSHATGVPPGCRQGWASTLAVGEQITHLSTASVGSSNGCLNVARTINALYTSMHWSLCYAPHCSIQSTH